MPLKLMTPVEKIEKLLKADQTGETFVAVVQATQGTVAKLEDFRTSGTEYYWDDKEENRTMHMRPSKGSAELRRMQVYCTLRNCNILDANGQQLFKCVSDGSQSNMVMSEKDFQNAWDSLPPDVADEIYEKVLIVNPQWSNRGE